MSRSKITVFLGLTAVTALLLIPSFALSVTGDPTGAYSAWRYSYPEFALNEDPKVGVGPNGYHMTFNQFNNASTLFLGR